MGKNFKDDFKDDEEDEEVVTDEEEVVEEQPLRKPSPKGVIKTYAKESDYDKAKQQQQQEEAVTDRYLPYHVPERYGIIDSKTQKPVSEATEVMALILDSQTKILNKLQEIIDGLG